MHRLVNAVAGRLSLRPPQRHSHKILDRIRGSADVPDFVAETEDALLMIETKARNQLTTPEVEAKRKAAEEWCQHASAHAATYGGKPWRHALVPYDIVADNKTLANLAGDAKV